MLLLTVPGVFGWECSCCEKNKYIGFPATCYFEEHKGDNRALCNDKQTCWIRESDNPIFSSIFNEKMKEKFRESFLAEESRLKCARSAMDIKRRKYTMCKSCQRLLRKRVIKRIPEFCKKEAEEWVNLVDRALKNNPDNEFVKEIAEAVLLEIPARLFVKVLPQSVGEVEDGTKYSYDEWKRVFEGSESEDLMRKVMQATNNSAEKVNPMTDHLSEVANLDKAIASPICALFEYLRDGKRNDEFVEPRLQPGNGACAQLPDSKEDLSLDEQFMRYIAENEDAMHAVQLWTDAIAAQGELSGKNVESVLEKLRGFSDITKTSAETLKNSFHDDGNKLNIRTIDNKDVKKAVAGMVRMLELERPARSRANAVDGGDSRRRLVRELV